MLINRKSSLVFYFSRKLSSSSFYDFSRCVSTGQKYPLLWSNYYHKYFSTDTSYELADAQSEENKTSVDILNEETDRVLFSGYTNFGFRLSSGAHILGPCVAFPKAVMQWIVSGAHDIKPTSLSLFSLLDPKPDLLIIGRGMPRSPMDITQVLKFGRENKMNIEILPTVQALGMFNFMNSEGRAVACALLPVADDEVYVEDHHDLEKMKERRELHHWSAPPSALGSHGEAVGVGVINKQEDFRAMGTLPGKSYASGPPTDAEMEVILEMRKRHGPPVDLKQVDICTSYELSRARIILSRRKRLEKKNKK